MLSSCQYVTSMKGINAGKKFIESPGRIRKFSQSWRKQPKNLKVVSFHGYPQPTGAQSIVLINLLRTALHWFPSVPCLFSYSPKAGFATALKLPYTFMGVSSSMDIALRNYNFEYQIQTDGSGSSKLLPGFLEK